MLNEIDPTTPSMEAFCSQVVPQLVESGVATVLPEEPWAEVATLVWADRVPQALAQRRNNLNSLVPEELHDRLHGVTSEPGLLRFDIFPRAWQHHRSPAIIVLLGCECEESPLAAMRGSTDLWEMIFSYIPLRVQLNWDLNTTHDALQTRFTLLISSFTEYIEVTQVRRHPLVSSQAMGEGSDCNEWANASTDSTAVEFWSSKHSGGVERLEFERSGDNGLGYQVELMDVQLNMWARFRVG
eukprot:TRINITY_DN16821_c0_g1_i3.p1 TRINITY_DN16821_c0_g1~~TRINITY_DN16821_c0_g1_i3.p1  ORF type:complete len:241 (-),score=37.48 TRINITY_DN16821_c0_g1_i3:395-1117(-)